MKIVFIDDAARAAYDGAMLLTQGMGGSESSLIRVAQGLVRYHQHEVWVVQAARDATAPEVVYQGVRYISHGVLQALAMVPDVVIHQRESKHIAACHKRWPYALQVYWLHNMFDRLFARELPLFERYGVQVIGVSQYHRMRMRQVLQRTSHRVAIDFIYNPIDDGLSVDLSAAYDPYLLSYTSSPDRGLARTIEMVNALRMRDARYRLQVFYPGYVATKTRAQVAHIIYNGSLPCVALNRAIQNSLCVLQANTDVPEMFGLVYVEANQVGVPVLTHPHGAAPEVLADERQLMDMHDTEAVVQRIQEWSHGGRIAVHGRTLLAVGSVVHRWQELLVQWLGRTTTHQANESVT